jgi:glycerol kinase
LHDLAALWTGDEEFGPRAPTSETEPAHQAWLRAVERSRGWADDG